MPTEFNGRLTKQAWMVAPETLKVMRALHLDGGEARFVGGCVRDALVNRPVVDIDIATPLKPEEVIARLKKSGLSYAPTGLKHGTVTAIADGRPFEVTTLRVDVRAYGRHADVQFTGDWQADAARRDFTINAMSATQDGDVSDPFGGMTDLREGRVVFVGEAEARIREDALRILRFFRFHAHFGRGAPDPRALAACEKAAGDVSRLSPERIRQETLKLLEADGCAPVWRLMIEKGIAPVFLPEAMNAGALDALVALEARYQSRSQPLRRLAALLEVNAEGVRDVAAALRLSGAQEAQLGVMALPPPEVSTVMDHAAARRLVYRLGNDAARSLLLLSAAKAGEENDLRSLYDWATRFSPPALPVNGADATALGAQGPAVGRLLRAVESWWLEEDFRPGRAACLARLKETRAGAGP